MGVAEFGCIPTRVIDLIDSLRLWVFTFEVSHGVEVRQVLIAHLSGVRFLNHGIDDPSDITLPDETA